MNNYNFTTATIKRRGGSTATPTDRLLRANRFYSQKMADKALYRLSIASDKDGLPIAFMLSPTDSKGDGVVKTAKNGVLNCSTLSELFFEGVDEKIDRLDFNFRAEKDNLIFELKNKA